MSGKAFTKAAKPAPTPRRGLVRSGKTLWKDPNGLWDPQGQRDPGTHTDQVFASQEWTYGNTAEPAFRYPPSTTPPADIGFRFGNIAVLPPSPAGLQPKLIIGEPNDRFEQEADQVADTVMRMPAPTVAWGETVPRAGRASIQRLCAECDEKMRRQPVEEEEELAQTKRATGPTPKLAPGLASSIQALQGSGQPLHRSQRAFFEPRFGTDFSQVRIHADARAAEVARNVNARAFTLGRDVVFAPGEYAPGTDRGRRLLAHELTHVVQQVGGRHAQQRPITPNVLLQKKPRKRALDEKALTIVNAAQNSKTAIDKRAIQAVKDIINAYYPSQAELVKEVVYKESEPGLRTTAATFPDAKGTITVGKYFVTHTTKTGFARRVLQVDHELEHVRQQRRGLGGPHRADLREFLAFTREALSPELPGTGRVSHSTRVALIDAALKHYYKLDKDQRTKYSNERDRLLKARKEHAAKSGRKHEPPPGPAP